MATEDKKYLDLTGLSHFKEKLEADIAAAVAAEATARANADANKVDKINRSAATEGLYKVAINAQGQVTSNTAVSASDITAISGLEGIKNNQTVKGAGTAFGANAAVNIVAGGNISVTPDTTNNKITIAYTGAAGNDNQTVKAGTVTFGANDVVNYVGSNGITVAGDATNKTITISHTNTGKTTAEGAYKIAVDAAGHVTAGAALATVASSGKYTDLTDKPTIGSGVLTIQAAGTSKGTFSANATSNVTVNITAADLGLDSAMHYVGAGQSDVPTTHDYIHDKTTGLYIPVRAKAGSSAVEIDAQKGDVFTSGSKEYVIVTAGKYATPNASQLLGDEGSYAIKSTTISGGDGLSGGGSLAANRTITHAVPTGAAAAGGESSQSLYKIATDKFGHVTYKTAVTETGSTGSSHSHTISGTVTVPTVSKTTTKLSVSKTTTSVVTGYTPTSKKLTTATKVAVGGTVSVNLVSGGTEKDIAKAGTAVVYGKADVGTAVTYGTANPAASVSTFVTGSTLPAYNASYNGTDTLVLSQVTFSTANVRGCVASSLTLTPAKAAPNTQTIVPAVDNGKLKGSYTIGTAQTVAIPEASAFTYATGSAAADGAGASFIDALGTPATATALTGASIAAGTNGDVTVVDSTTIGSTTATVGGSTNNSGSHTHNI